MQEARAALRRVEAERAALEECLAVTTSVSAPLPALPMSMSLQPAPVTPQPHRNANPTSDLSDGIPLILPTRARSLRCQVCPLRCNACCWEPSPGCAQVMTHGSSAQVRSSQARQRAQRRQQSNWPWPAARAVTRRSTQPCLSSLPSPQASHRLW